MAIKISELTDLSADELVERLAETKEELFNLRFQNATGQLDNYKRLGELRRDVARIRTVLRQRELTGHAEELSPPTEAKIDKVAEERESQFRPRRSRGAGTAPGGAAEPES